MNDIILCLYLTDVKQNLSSKRYISYILFDKVFSSGYNLKIEKDIEFIGKVLMRVLLIEPPFHAFMNYDRWWYPISLAQLAAVAHAANHEVIIYDGDKYFYKDLSTRQRNIFIKKQDLYYDNVDNFEHRIWRHLKQALEDLNPEIVGVSVCTCKLKSVINTLKLVRQFNPSIKTCVGGAHVSAVPESLASNDCIDAVFTGYADQTFPEWLTGGCRERGIIHADIKKIDFDNLPYARRKSLLFPEEYTPRDLGQMITSRGCPGRCTFCSNSLMWPGKLKFRTSSSIIAELTELVREWNVRDILLTDASFSDNPVECKRIAKILKDFGMRWQANVRWSISKDLLEHYINCGCYQILVGLESGSDKILRYMKKGWDKNFIREKVRMINSSGIEWHLYCVTGFPVETIEDMEETMEFILELNPNSVSLNSLSPLPGTEIYNAIPGMTLELASSVNQLYPNYSFSKYMDTETYKDMFVKMTAIFDEYNRKREVKQRGSLDQGNTG